VPDDPYGPGRPDARMSQASPKTWMG